VQVPVDDGISGEQGRFDMSEVPLAKKLVDAVDDLRAIPQILEGRCWKKIGRFGLLGHVERSKFTSEKPHRE
jgi:hypothetical protein